MKRLPATLQFPSHPILIVFWFIATGCAATPSSPSTGMSTVYGSVELLPPTGVRLHPDRGDYADRRYRGIDLVDYGQVDTCVVHLDGPPPPVRETTIRLVEKKGKADFSTSFLAIGVGSPVIVLNDTSTPHTVSVPDTGHLFALEAGGMSTIEMARPGAITLNLLDDEEAQATVFVSPGPFTRPSPGGRFALTSVPPGDHVLRAWHARLPACETSISLAADSVREVELTIGVHNLSEPSPEASIPAMPPPAPPATEPLPTATRDIPAQSPPSDPADGRIRELEARVRALEESPGSGSGEHSEAIERLASWVERFHLSGNADFVFFEGESRSKAPEGKYAVENARFFFDIDLASDVGNEDTTLFENASVFFEWELYRDAVFKNDFGSLYLRFDRLLGSSWLNLKMGRMQIPYGEEYLRFSQDRPKNPLFSFSAPAAYGWDEGLMLFGGDGTGELDYSLAVMDGDSVQNVNTNSDPMLVGKLAYRPSDWAYLSVSGLSTGKLDAGSSAAATSFLLGGVYFTPLGTFQDLGVPNFQNGVGVPDDPSRALDSSHAAEIDVILTDEDLGRLWLAFGRAGIRSRDGSSYDRDLTYWIAEAVLELGSVTESLRTTYLAARWSGIGTFDADEGALLPVKNEAGDLGYNVRRVDLMGIGFGWRVTPNITFKTEYSWFDFDLVRGVTADIRGRRRDRNFLATGFSVSF